MPRGDARDGRTRDPQRGSATVYVVALVVVLLSVAVGAGGFGRLITAKHRAAAAADLAALAGARALVAGETPAPCAVAAGVARRNGGEVLRCADDGRNVTVIVGLAVALPFGYRPTVRERARAGPAP